jgi:hypothetical protein
MQHHQHGIRRLLEGQDLAWEFRLHHLRHTVLPGPGTIISENRPIIDLVLPS